MDVRERMVPATKARKHVDPVFPPGFGRTFGGSTLFSRMETPGKADGRARGPLSFSRAPRRGRL
eukprot:3858940-Pyramimonas_sp.AAC.1